MNKKLNTILFIVAATIVNVVIMVVLTLVPLAVFWGLFAKSLDQTLVMVISMLLLTAAIVGTFFIYNTIMKAFIAKVDLDKYFDPLFKSFFKKK